MWRISINRVWIAWAHAVVFAIWEMPMLSLWLSQRGIGNLSERKTCERYAEQTQIRNKKCISTQTHVCAVLCCNIMFAKTVTNCDMELCYLVVLMPSAALVIYYELNRINFRVRFVETASDSLCHMWKYPFRCCSFSYTNKKRLIFQEQQGNLCKMNQIYAESRANYVNDFSESMRISPKKGMSFEKIAQNNEIIDKFVKLSTQTFCTLTLLQFHNRQKNSRLKQEFRYFHKFRQIISEDNFTIYRIYR